MWCGQSPDSGLVWAPCSGQSTGVPASLPLPHQSPVPLPEAWAPAPHTAPGPRSSPQTGRLARPKRTLSLRQALPFSGPLIGFAGHRTGEIEGSHCLKTSGEPENPPDVTVRDGVWGEEAAEQGLRERHGARPGRHLQRISPQEEPATADGGRENQTWAGEESCPGKAEGGPANTLLLPRRR